MKTALKICKDHALCDWTPFLVQAIPSLDGDVKLLALSPLSIAHQFERDVKEVT